MSLLKFGKIFYIERTEKFPNWIRQIDGRPRKKNNCWIC